MSDKSNSKKRQKKRDPYQLTLRLVIVLAVVLVVGFGVFFLCRMMIENEFIAKRNEMDSRNAEAEQEFNDMLNAARSRSTLPEVSAPEAEEGELPFWENTIDDTILRIESEGRAGLENIGSVRLDRAAIINGGMLLVNEWHFLPTDFSGLDVISVGTASSFKVQVQDASVELFPVAYDALSAMITDAETLGLKDYIVREGYRSNDVQTKLFNDERDKQAANYSGDALIERTKRSVNFPGTSDYQTGMTFRMDLYPLKDGVRFQQSEQGKWFTENCWKYGVVFRYPTADFPNSSWEDKSFKTGVTRAMNIYRYVGKAHSTAMRILDYCLEEYVDFLIKNPHVCIYVDGALKYEIFRIPTDEVLDSYELPVPNPATDYQASFDNMGGIVMAYTY